MRLLVHNLWKCNQRKCDAYPLAIDLADEAMCTELARVRQVPSVEAYEIIEEEYNPQRVVSMLAKVNYDVLVGAAECLDHQLPHSYTDGDLEDDQFLKTVHTALFEIHVLEGSLQCTECKKIFPISKGIPRFTD